MPEVQVPDNSCASGQETGFANAAIGAPRPVCWRAHRIRRVRVRIHTVCNSPKAPCVGITSLLAWYAKDPEARVRRLPRNLQQAAPRSPPPPQSSGLNAWQDACYPDDLMPQGAGFTCCRVIGSKARIVTLPVRSPTTAAVASCWCGSYQCLRDEATGKNSGETLKSHRG